MGACVQAMQLVEGREPCGVPSWGPAAHREGAHREGGGPIWLVAGREPSESSGRAASDLAKVRLVVGRVPQSDPPFEGPCADRCAARQVAARGAVPAAVSELCRGCSTTARASPSCSAAAKVAVAVVVESC